ncbi:MAG: hypothetical protein AB3N21_13810 [Ruegeria sp.]|uniref:hypothetical protein n=1 Tax=Ruegeria sp. TaxID=1879320 RepID=UPI00349EB869
MTDDQPANLRPRVTVKQAAELMNVSERSVYLARAVNRLRPDLATEIEAGRLSINEAHRIATGKSKPTCWDRLVKAWSAASPAEQKRFYSMLRQQEGCDGA